MFLDSQHFLRTLRASTAAGPFGVLQLRVIPITLRSQPQLPPALLLRGRLALKNGQRSEAETSLRQALKGNPLDHRARYNLVLFRERSGQEE